MCFKSNFWTRHSDTARHEAAITYDSRLIYRKMKNVIILQISTSTVMSATISLFTFKNEPSNVSESFALLENIFLRIPLNTFYKTS